MILFLAEGADFHEPASKLGVADTLEGAMVFIENDKKKGPWKRDRYYVTMLNTNRQPCEMHVIYEDCDPL